MLIGEVAVGDGGVLGQDRDALFALEVGRVHHPLGDLFVGAEDPGLAEHGVHQGRLAVVNVGDYGHVAYVSASHFAQFRCHSGVSRRAGAHQGSPLQGTRWH